MKHHMPTTTGKPNGERFIQAAHIAFDRAIGYGFKDAGDSRTDTDTRSELGAIKQPRDLTLPA